MNVAARARPGHRRRHRRLLRGPGPHHVGEQRAPGRRAAGRHHHPPGGRHGARPHLPGRQQGRLRRPRRPLRDGRDVRARHPARPARPHGRGRRGGRHRQPRAAHVGRQRVRPGRVPPGPHRRARRGAATSRSPSSPRASRASRCASPPGPARSRTSPRCSTRRRSRCGAPSTSASATSSSASTTSRWRSRWPSRLIARGLTFGVAESLTGGLIASRLVNVPGASAWFRGGVVAYDSQVKFDVLGVPAGPVVTEAAAAAMAEGAARVTGADVGLGITGVAGPDDQEGVAPGHRLRRPPPPRPADPDPRAAGARRPGARAPVRGHFGPRPAPTRPRRPSCLSGPRSQEAHSGVTLDGQSGRDPVTAGRYGQVKTDNGPRVLVVDDEPSIVDAVATSLRYEGFTVDEAMTGRKALAQAQEDPPDLVDPRRDAARPRRPRGDAAAARRRRCGCPSSSSPPATRCRTSWPA